MRFADLGLVVAVLLAALWLVALVALGRGESSSRWVRLLSPPACVVGGIGAVLLVSQAAVVDAVEDGTAVARWDRPVLDWIEGHRDGVLTAVMRAVSAVGGTVGMTVLAVAAVVVLIMCRRRPHAVLVAVTALGAAALDTGFKHLYERARPPLTEQLTPETTFALPSGHSLGSTAVLGVLAVIGLLLLRRGVWRAGAVVVAMAGVLIIGVSRLYLGVHWLTDVLTGWLLGGAWLAMCVTALLVYQLRRDARRRGRVGEGGPVVSVASPTTALP